MPNEFTPNSDSFNDLFTPVEPDGIIDLKYSILNCWGNTIFETNDLQINGNGENHKEGIYY